MLDNYVKFYQKYDLDNILKTCKANVPHQKVKDDSTYKNLIGYFKDDTPYIFEIRKHWKDKNLTTIPEKEYMEVHVKENQDFLNVVLPMASKRAGRRIDKLSLIVDFDDAPLKHF